MTDEQPDYPPDYGGEGGEGGEGEPPKDGEFDGITYLYIRTHPADTGAEPLAAGLQFWTSPDIWIVKPNGGVGGQAVPNQVNQVQVTVTNAGGIPAIDALVDAFVADPAFVITPATATPVGSGYLDIPAYSTATISFPWTPQPGDAGHRCIVARVSLVAPLDTYTNPAAFEVVQDRHVAQRNIQVLQVSQGQSVIFPFLLGNATLESLKVTERTRELKLDDVVTLAGRIGGLPAKVPLGDLKIRQVEARELAELRERPEFPGLARRVGAGRGLGAGRRVGEGRHAMDVTEATVRDRPESVRLEQFAAVTIRPPARDEAGHLHVFDVTQVDERGEVVGGLTFVVQVV